MNKFSCHFQFSIFNFQLLSLLLLLASCGPNDTTPAPGAKLPDGAYPLEITARVADGLSRAFTGKTAWVDGDLVGVKIISADGLESAGTYTASTDGSFSATSPAYWPRAEASTVMAWYPATDHPVDLTDQRTATVPDILVATATSCAFGEPANLTFTHALAGVQVKVVNGFNSPLYAKTSDVRMFCPATLAGPDGTTLATAVGGILADPDNEAQAYNALVVPGDIYISATVDGKTYIYTPTPDEMPTAGTTRVYTISILGGDFNLVDGGSIILGGGHHRFVGNGQPIKFYISMKGSGIITLSNVNFSGNSGDSPISITNNSDVTIILEGTNTVTSTEDNYSAIYVEKGSTLTLKGEGSLTATGGMYAAGIGGGYPGGGTQKAAGAIVIKSGTIAATGDDGAAGIGSGIGGSCEEITILGGDITTIGGINGAGIGSGSHGSCGNITISGGKVKATGGSYAAGIGSGFTGSCGTIAISGGDVTAETDGDANYPAAAIGSGDEGDGCSSIKLENCVIRVPALDGSLMGTLNGIWANGPVTPDLLNPVKVDAAGVKLYVGGKPYK